MQSNVETGPRRGAALLPHRAALSPADVPAPATTRVTRVRADPPEVHAAGTREYEVHLEVGLVVREYWVWAATPMAAMLDVLEYATAMGSDPSTLGRCHVVDAANPFDEIGAPL